MALLIRHLPTIQNWDCHQCGNCCRDLFVPVSAEERRRIEDQGWSGRPEFAGRDLFVRRQGQTWLAHQPGGACVFLGPDGRCRIHTEFGARAKPLACQVFPFILVPAGRELRVSLRFSCPSAAASRGRPLADHSELLRAYARQLVPDDRALPAPPHLRRGQPLDWPEVFHLVNQLDWLLSNPQLSIAQRLIQALALISLLDAARLETVRGARMIELLNLVTKKLVAEAVPPLSEVAEPTRTGRLLFRQVLAQYARQEMPLRRTGLRDRWALLAAALRFARGRGAIPRLHPRFGDATFARLDQPFGPLPADATALLERFYRVKLSGLQFCGPAYYGVPLSEGFRSLALTYPVILWMARWLSAGQGRSTLTAADVAGAVEVLDYHYGYSPVFGFRRERGRVRWLAARGQIERLIGYYGRE